MEDQSKKIAIGAAVGGILGGVVSVIARGGMSPSGAISRDRVRRLPDGTIPLDDLKEMAEEALGWAPGKARSLSLGSLQENVRFVDPWLYREIIKVRESGSHVSAAPPPNPQFLLIIADSVVNEKGLAVDYRRIEDLANHIKRNRDATSSYPLAEIELVKVAKKSKSPTLRKYAQSALTEPRHWWRQR